MQHGWCPPGYSTVFAGPGSGSGPGSVGPGSRSVIEYDIGFSFLNIMLHPPLFLSIDLLYNKGNK
ncbi:MAG: hypothetical protein A3G99_01265 [Candidatus Zambryskibacteria bacterium RIFCSPLOWO2_12_FULL_39_23]|uniref:Uncharacterized protein n=1 Tax=Candidatus Zambryskibacteria bacterium RIFCSPLOWO2_12_FULL_39_23 TaxID=1802776 RepID=A0A1G2URX6_9BACT|nr:MAG: hypothetical protein A2W51_02070 [Candidatus Zambryskibacteria bacterium RIFCSPHIGHO2_02_39_10]OHB00012.1 MAG: hypothetical protein A3E59_00195 [Candidatus Zambryskibacteria bacterium RIFCSPHIGHO2_12_FULL_39_47]OHB12110.1 MAG: hypothetical protein A3G99_01265 [Candidatus Zambryskibacteria bacterium RIFCSPLOWO2_12_FULL_39_23]